MTRARGPVTWGAALALAAALAGCSGGTAGAAPASSAAATTTAGATTAGATTTGATTTAGAPATTTPGVSPTATRTPTAPVTNSATSTRDAAKETSLADGRYPANIAGVDASRRTVTIDVVQFFGGDAAAKAAAEDGGESPPPNDYWIRNASPRLRTFTVTPGAAITVNTLAVEETGSATKDVPRTLARLDAYGDIRNRLFWVTVKDGRVTRLAEQFLP